MLLRPFAAVLGSTALLLGQHALTTRLGTVVNGRTGAVVGAAGDVDADGVPDFLVSTPQTGTGVVQVFSGRTRSLLHAMTGRAGHGLGNYASAVIGDVDLDGVDDVVVPSDELEVFSGATGARLWVVGAPLSYSDRVCAAGDVDSDGRADLADIVHVNNDDYLWILSGLNGAQLQTMTAPLPSGVRQLHALGDTNGNGHGELAGRSARSIAIYGVSPLRLLRTITDSTTQFEQLLAADMNGDGRNEIVVSTNIAVRVYSPTTGALLRTFATNYTDGIFAVIGDLDSDGVPDLAGFDGTVDVARGIPHRRILLHSGLDGHSLGDWSASFEFSMQEPVLAAVGDVDRDGYGDLLIGDERAGDYNNPTGGWQLVSGRVLASMRSIPVQCAGGPFLPQLGITRPVLGQALTLVGRDCPPQAWGTVIFSLQPDHERNLGVSGCDAWFDFGTWTPLYLPPQGSSWQLTVPLPNVPQLAGLGTALQMIHGPTNSAIGFDLSNAIWARFGF